MHRRLLLLVPHKIASRIACLILACWLAPLAIGQSPGPATGEAPKADSSSKEPEYKEDFTTPSLGTSQIHLTKVEGPMFDPVHEGYTVQVWRLTWRPGDPIEVYVIKPDGVKKPPVILNLYGYPNDTNPYKVEGVQKEMVKGGFAVVGFVSALTGQRYHDMPVTDWFLSELQQSLATTAHDVQILIDYLSKRGDLDVSRIGMFGNGSGGTIAILASAVDPRIKVLDVMDPWGDWPTWLATSTFPPADERPNFVNPEFLKKVSTLEPLEWMAKIQAKKFRLQQPTFDSDTPNPVREKFRAAAPASTVMVQYKSMDEFKAAFHYSCNLDWLKHELSSLPDSAATEKASGEKPSIEVPGEAKH